MSNSKLVNKTILTSANYDKGRDGHKIKKITIHHCAGVMSIEQIGAFFKNGSRQVSAHYGIGNDGKIVQCVDEKNTAWTDGNWESNCTSVTIETSNSKTGGQWPVSDKALNSLIKLVADIGYRNNLGTLVKGKNVTWHSMYVSTTCPGNYLRSKMSYIVSEANKINFERNVKYTLGYYKTKNTVNVRSGPGTNYSIKKVKDLTADGKKHATSKNSNASAVYKKNTLLKITSIISGANNSIWGKSPSGYVCLKNKNGTYCTKTKTDSSYTLGNYQTNMSMNIRTGAGTSYRIKKVSEMTTSGKKHALSQNENASASYKKGTKFTANELVKNSSGNYWLKSPSGYICLKNSKITYCKKI